jgi:tetratricopeptide (TPR) repeat protein
MGASTVVVQHESFQPPDPIFWRPPAQLLEWGCALFRKDEAPRPIERWWQLAALGVAERAEDFEFLVGSPFEARGNPKDEMEHLNHVAARFPNERRFALAQGIALEWRSWPEHPKGSARRGSGVRDAQLVFESLQSDDVVGAEATMRLGVLRYRENATDEALKLFDKVEDATRDRYVIYLARYFRGQALERKSLLPDAERAYRSALDTIPGAQSAAMALSHLLFTRGAHQDAAALVNASLAMQPQPADPWRGWADADDRFWPELIARLRAEIKK